MNPDKKLPNGGIDKGVRFLASFFYVGYAPVVPGTFGSAAGLILAWFFPAAILPLIIVVSVVGLALCAPSRRAFGAADPSKFVTDEVAGMLISIIAVPHSLVWYAAGFLGFRLFDVVKPWPISAVQNSRHPSSIMWDDILAGVFVNVILQCALHLHK